MAIRNLRADEIRLAWNVFKDSLPYNKIKLSDELGIGGRPWVRPSGSGFVIYIGPVGYRDAKQIAATFIHELTHVWQGSHGFVLGYVFESLKCQAMLGDKAYVPVLGDPPGRYSWESFNPEQQATIVENWYAKDRMSTQSPRYQYIKMIRSKSVKESANYNNIF